jgi:cell division transport system ATP-binding protein
MIECKGVALLHPRGGSPLVSDATFAVEAGKVALIVAAAGVGSSRMMAALLGEAECVAGQICVLGHDVGKLRRASLRHLRRRIGIVPQDLCLLEDRSAQLNVVLPLEIDGVPRSISVIRAVEVLAQMELGDEAALPIDVLSRSARQRVAVARALVRRPAILLADHPTSDQDAIGAQLVCRAIDSAAAAGAACLVFGRDPMLRVYAESKGWSQWQLAGGQLRALHDTNLGAEPSQEISITMESDPILLPAFDDDEPFSNLLPFPGAASGAR